MRRHLKEKENYVRDCIYDNYKFNNSIISKSFMFYISLMVVALLFDYILIKGLFNFESVTNLILNIVGLLLSLFFSYIGIVYVKRKFSLFFKVKKGKDSFSNIEVFETELIRVEKGNYGYNDIGYVLDENGKETFGILMFINDIENNHNKCLLAYDPVNVEIRYIFPRHK